MINTTPQSLYEQDFVAWCEDAIAKLKTGKLYEIDVDSLIEELEGPAARDIRELESRLQGLLNHLLKRMYVNSPNALSDVREDYPDSEFPTSGHGTVKSKRCSAKSFGRADLLENR